MYINNKNKRIERERERESAQFNACRLKCQACCDILPSFLPPMRSKGRPWSRSKPPRVWPSDVSNPLLAAESWLHQSTEILSGPGAKEKISTVVKSSKFCIAISFQSIAFLMR